MKHNVVHISQTPLVGSPGDIVHALNAHTKYDSSWIFLEDYPEPLKGKFGANAVFYEKSTEDVCKLLIQKANIIHIHNTIAPTFISFLEKYKNIDVKFVYQVHNARREGPIFFNMEDYMPFRFDANLVVAQHQVRSMPHYTMVPNIVNIKPRLHLLQNNEKPRLLFLPSHKRSDNRWGIKTTNELEEILDSLHKLKLIELVSPQEKMTPNILANLRKTTHISFDEIFTGSFHRVSLEAFVCGNVAVNGADDISILTMMSLLGTNEKPPFYFINQNDISNGFLELFNNKEKIRKFQQDGYDYFNKYLKPEALIQHYTKIYDTL
jgi:hypothetical protein